MAAFSLKQIFSPFGIICLTGAAIMVADTLVIRETDRIQSMQRSEDIFAAAQREGLKREYADQHGYETILFVLEIMTSDDVPEQTKRAFLDFLDGLQWGQKLIVAAPGEGVLARYTDNGDGEGRLLMDPAIAARPAALQRFIGEMTAQNYGRGGKILSLKNGPDGYAVVTADNPDAVKKEAAAPQSQTASPAP